MATTSKKEYSLVKLNSNLGTQVSVRVNSVKELKEKLNAFETLFGSQPLVELNLCNTYYGQAWNCVGEFRKDGYTYSGLIDNDPSFFLTNEYIVVGKKKFTIRPSPSGASIYLFVNRGSIFA